MTALDTRRPTRGLTRRASVADDERSGRGLVGLELVTGASALLCGALLVARPGGSLLGPPVQVLEETSFQDWRLPGLLLAVVMAVGATLVVLALRTHRTVAGAAVSGDLS